MKLWRVLALSAAACATSTAVHAAEEGTASAASDLSGDDSGLLSFLTQEFTRSSALVQRFFFDDGEEQDVAPGATLQFVIVEEGEGDDALEDLFFSPQQDEEEELADLTRQQQQQACLTALKVLHEQDDSKQERKQLSQRLRSPFKRAFHAMSLHFLDEASCDDLEDSRLVDECHRVVDMEDAVRQFMTRGRSNEQVCTLVYREEQVVEPKQVQGELSCKLCKRFVQMVDQALAQEVSQVQQVREIIGDICDSMAADSMCHTFLNQYDQIVNWLKEGMEPSAVCLRIKMCIADKKDKLEQLSDLTTIALVQNADEDHACFYCVHIAYVVGKVNEIAPSQLNNVRTLIKLGCTLSPKDCKCDLLVTNYDKIVGWVKQDKTTREICEALSICKKTDSPFAIRAPDESIEDALIALVPVPESESSQDGKTCFYCDYATTLIQVIMQEDAAQVDEIREYADMICGFLGPDNMCHQYVDKLDAVIDQLKKGKHPRDICASMKYCAAKANTRAEWSQAGAVAIAVTTQPEKVESVDQDHACFYCVHIAYVVGKVNEIAPSQLNNVRTLIKLGCTLSPKDCKCDLLVTNYDKIVGWVKQDKTTREICEALSICKKTDSPFAIRAPDESIEDALIALVPVPESESSQDGKTCFYC
ncbi:Proactivator polypeptide, partial [Globisporangium polare]